VRCDAQKHLTVLKLNITQGYKPVDLSFCWFAAEMEGTVH
jgi:hypothetical protein